MEKCDIVLLQETVITDYNSNELDLTAEGNIAMTCMPAEQCTNVSAGRPSAGLTIYWSSVNKLTCETIRYTDRLNRFNPQNK